MVTFFFLAAVTAVLAVVLSQRQLIKFGWAEGYWNTAYQSLMQQTNNLTVHACQLSTWLI